MLQMVTVETESELWHHVGINQVPRNLSGNLVYDHHEWLDSMKVCVCVRARARVCVRACVCVHVYVVCMACLCLCVCGVCACVFMHMCVSFNH